MIAVGGDISTLGDVCEEEARAREKAEPRPDEEGEHQVGWARTEKYAT
jgi:hypothetical protein